MGEFMIPFLLANLPISGIIVLFLAVKRFFRPALTGRTECCLGFLLPAILAVPFLSLLPASLIPADLVSFHFPDFSRILSWLTAVGDSFRTNTGAPQGIAAGSYPDKSAGWMEDFALSVSGNAPSAAGSLLLAIWVAGILAAALGVLRSALGLRRLKKSALPLQDQRIRRLYRQCLRETGITKNIPLYSAAFLHTPMISGWIRPGIYLPVSIISDCRISSRQNNPEPPCRDGLRSIRFMLLHELQHYRHRDILFGYLTTLAAAVYWFNPFVRYALRSIQDDRETACDDAVLQIAGENSAREYGDTLIDFAEWLSLRTDPFAVGLGGDMRQIQRRIVRIAAYEKPTRKKKLKSAAAFTLTAALILGLAPTALPHAAGNSRYHWSSFPENISAVNLSAYFEDFEGAFVLYDPEGDSWTVYNENRALLRTAPNSTYKIYGALLGLEEGVITPENSRMAWDHKSYPFEAWNRDQTLRSAMQSSVNWYFQTIDERLGRRRIEDYLRKIGYGNTAMGKSLSDYWMDSSLEISPVEQILLLNMLQDNVPGFDPENVRAVKDAIRLFASDTGTLYGKTGTGQTDGRDVNGWFVGFAETTDGVRFFATNIAADRRATGSRAAEITLAILSHLGIWEAA